MTGSPSIELITVFGISRVLSTNLIFSVFSNFNFFYIVYSFNKNDSLSFPYVLDIFEFFYMSQS